MSKSQSFSLDRDLGGRWFAKEDGKLYETVATGVLDANGKMTYKDQLVSESQIDARAALTATEYKKVDEVVTDVRNQANRFAKWLLSLATNVVSFDGLNHKTYWYNRLTGNTSSRSTMDLEDDAPGTSISTEEDGVPLPLEFADWTSNIRRDPTASMALGWDYAAEKARFAAESVGVGQDLRQINGWGGLTYRGVTVYGYRDLPVTMTVAQAGTQVGGGWLSPSVTPAQIYADITSMVKLMNAAKIPGPYVLTLPESFRFRLGETFSTDMNGNDKSLWMKILEKPSADIPNVLGIAQVKLVPQMDRTFTGGVPACGEAYLQSLDPKYFRVLNYMPMQSFTIALKGTIATKHRVVEGVCPLFKKDTNGVYGMVKLVQSAS